MLSQGDLSINWVLWWLNYSILSIQQSNFVFQVDVILELWNEETKWSLHATNEERKSYIYISDHQEMHNQGSSK